MSAHNELTERLWAKMAGGRMGERSIIVAYLRKGAAVMLTSDMAELHDPDDRREIETAARALEAAADEIEKGAHIG